MFQTRRARRRFVLLATAACIAPLSQAWAQQSAGLEEVVVTALRREENLQRTPVSVTALTATALEQRGIENVADLGNRIANLSMISGQGGGSTQNQISIRGVGQSDFILTSDQSVGLYVDGVYVARSLGAALDLLDIERIEVLRGPQGTLFGRNTTAGAVQVISAPPLKQFGGSLEATTGSDDRADVKGVVNVPLLDGKLLARLSVASLQQGGYGRRLAQNSDGADHDILAARLAFRATLSDSVDADLVFDGTRRRGHGGLARLTRIDPTDPNLAFYNSTLTAQGLAPADGRWITADTSDTYAGDRNHDDNNTFGLAATLNWYLGDVTAKSITAYRRIGATSSYDFDGTPYPLSEQLLNLRQNQLSQELQLSGRSFGDRLKWIVGGFYFHENASDNQDVPFYQPVVATGGGAFRRLPGGFSFTSFIDQSTDSYAVYGQATYQLVKDLSATFGLRYTDERKELYSYLTGAFARAPGTVAQSWTDVSPRFGLDYQISDELMAYASVSRGFRSGGFNGRNTTPSPPASYDPETIWAYEVGVKSEMLNKRLRLNAAGFYYDYSDFQGLTLDSFSGITITTGNIAKVELYGAEVELQARPTDALQVYAGIGYTHQRISDVKAGAQITIRSDTRLVNAPDWTVSVGFDYTIPLQQFGTLELHGDYSFKSGVEFFLPNYPDEHQPAYDVVNARLTWRPASAPWEVQFFVNNIGDERYRLFAENGSALGIPATTAIYSRPREWGLRGKYRF